jgi:hypothetical protein
MLSIPLVDAQKDTLQLSEGVEQTGVVDYISPMEYAFMMHEETPWMFRIQFPNIDDDNYTGDINVSNGALWTIAFEQKISQVISLNAELHYNGDAYYYGTSAGGSLSPRFYYNMKKRINERKSQSNLSGEYIALGTALQWYSRRTERLDLFLEWGMQRRYLKNGFFGYSIKAGLSNELGGDNEKGLTAGSQIKLGLAFTPNRYQLDADKLCSVFKCYASESNMLKINVANVLNSNFVDDFLYLNSRLDIAYEQKLTSVFSINNEISGGIQRTRSRFNFNGDIGRRRTLNIRAKSGIRYYYNLKKRIAKGKSGNGLSANYLTLETHFENYKAVSILGDSRAKFSNNSWGVALLYGIQRTILDHYYFDVSWGFTYYDYYEDPQNINEDLLFSFQFGAGFRF